MKRIRHLISAVAGGAMLIAATGPLAADPLRVGIAAEPYPPFTYRSADGGWTGFEVELADLICDRINADCAITPTGWDGIIPALTGGRIDLIMTSMSITEQRQEVIDFSDPYYYTHGAYVAAKDMDLPIPDGLRGKVLGVQGATTHANYARQELRDVVRRIRIYEEQEQVNRDLQAGRIDVILADELPMADFVARDDAQDFEIKGMAPRHSAFGEGIGIGLRKGEDALRQRLNEAIATVIRDGSCAEISQKYFERDICGG